MVSSTFVALLFLALVSVTATIILTASRSANPRVRVEFMERHGHVRTLTVRNGTGTFVGEKNHALWWDEGRSYWYCGMNTSRVELFDNGRVPLPLEFDPLLMPPVFVLKSNGLVTRFAGPTRGFLRDGRETEHYRHTNMIVVVVEDGSAGGDNLSPEKLGVDPVDGLSVDIDFVW